MWRVFFRPRQPVVPRGCSGRCPGVSQSCRVAVAESGGVQWGEERGGGGGAACWWLQLCGGGEAGASA